MRIFRMTLSCNEYETFCSVLNHLCNLKNVKNTHGGVLFLVKLQAKACNVTKSKTPPSVFFFMFFKLYNDFCMQRTDYMENFTFCLAKTANNAL